MEFRKLRRIVDLGENQQVEFKRKARHPEKIVREMVAFANTDGGYLLLGIDDNKSIPGLKFPEEEHYILELAIKDLCRPALQYSFETVETPEGTGVIVYHIPESENKPHFAFLKAAHQFGKAFVRVEDRTIQASKEFRNILKKKGNASQQAFNYGDHEKMLMNYLGKHEKITLNEYSEISHLSQEKASDILINMAINNVIRIIPREREDWFVFVEN